VACGRPGGPPADPVPGIALNHQRQISRADLIDHWPFVPGTGTLACDQDAIAFRTQGVTYALNDAARARGYADVGPLVVARSGEPSQPLRRIQQDARMRIFADSAACASTANPSRCRLDVTSAHQLTPEELNQIDREGRERSWPPLTAHKQSVQPVVDLALALCAR
jgi:hypothetical protein